MSLGWQNPLPLQVGGGTTPTEAAYAQLLDALGEGWLPDELDRTVVGDWLASEALGLAAIASFDERAALQYFPDRATDAVGAFERMLGLTTGGDDLAPRIAANAAAWTSVASAEGPELREALQAIDPRADLLVTSFAQEDATQSGRPNGDAGEPYGDARLASEWPNYGGMFHVRVLFDVGYDGPLGAADLLVDARIKEHLCKVLPSVCDFAVITERGFRAGHSPLGHAGV